MRCCTNRGNVARVLLACLLWLGLSMAHAGGVAVNKAELRLNNDSYQPVVEFDIGLSFVVEQALTHGVPLYFVSEFSLVRPRWYWLNQTAAQAEQTTKLSYNVLTRQYRISHGALFQNFNNLEDALRVLNHQSFPSFPASLLKPGANHSASVRLHLDISQLPKPLQINALAGTDWDLDSGWFRWTLRAAGTPVNSSGVWDFD